MSLQLEDNQLRELIALQANMSNFATLEESSTYRPEVPISQDPKAWWRFVLFLIFNEYYFSSFFYFIFLFHVLFFIFLFYLLFFYVIII